jgi:uncharacterized protein YycO
LIGTPYGTPLKRNIKTNYSKSNNCSNFIETYQKSNASDKTGLSIYSNIGTLTRLFHDIPTKSEEACQQNKGVLMFNYVRFHEDGGMDINNTSTNF